MKISDASLHKIQYNIILYLSFLFWVIPEPYQKVFKISILVYFFFLCLKLFSYKIVPFKEIRFVAVGCFLLALSVYHSEFQTSVVNIMLSFFGLALAPSLSFNLTDVEKNKLKRWSIFFCFAMFIQMLFYHSEDGRPSLGYELNNSGAYLFLFFLFSDVIGSKIGKYFVLFASVLLLSRLLIFSLALFYIIRYFKHLVKERWSFNWYAILASIYVVFFAFNFYFLSNVEEGESYNSSRSRVTELNDGSNFLRFGINARILESIVDDENFVFGYGEIVGGKSPNYSYTYGVMPHNEMLDCIAEFGYVFTIYLFLYTGRLYKSRFTYKNYEYMLPIVLFTLLLWVRLLVVPSIEIYYIYSFLLCQNNYTKQL